MIWACTNCGACVNECPVDIEHIDHINGMRRHQVLVESAFPTEATTMLNNLERKGNPWGMAEDRRADWITELDFEVPVVDGTHPRRTSSTCTGSAAPARWRTGRRRPPRRSPSCCTPPGSSSPSSARPRPAPATRPAAWATSSSSRCSPSRTSRRSTRPASPGQGKKVIASCPHCFNTISREYPQLGGNYEVIHHTQLLARLVEDGKLTPVNPVDEKITYHDPCFLGRHNKVYTPPRAIIDAVPGTRAEEMHRCKGKGFCCGAGGARMWLEERTGKRINTERIDEALALDPDTVSTACPYCMVMLGDAVNAKKAAGQAKESLEVIDVAQLLVRAVKLREGAAEGTGSAEAWSLKGLNARRTVIQNVAGGPASAYLAPRCRPRHRRPRGEGDGQASGVGPHSFGMTGSYYLEGDQVRVAGARDDAHLRRPAGGREHIPGGRRSAAVRPARSQSRTCSP